MGTTVVTRKGSHRLVASGADQVTVGLSIPSESRLTQVWLEQHVIYVADSPVANLVMYGFTGHILPTLDPDTETDWDTIWDNQVPKDASFAASAFDHDTAGADATAEFEPGLADPSAVMGMSTAPNEVFRRRKRLSVANRQFAFKDATPDTFLPTDFWTATINKTHNIPVDSTLLFGFSNPDLLSTSATVPDALSLVNLTFLRYVDMTLRMAFMELLGAIEAGAETPWTEAAAGIQRFLEPVLLEQTAGRFASASVDVFTFMTSQIIVPGDIDGMTLTSE